MNDLIQIPEEHRESKAYDYEHDAQHPLPGAGGHTQCTLFRIEHVRNDRQKQAEDDRKRPGVETLDQLVDNKGKEQHADAESHGGGDEDAEIEVGKRANIRLIQPQRGENNGAVHARDDVGARHGKPEQHRLQEVGVGDRREQVAVQEKQREARHSGNKNENIVFPMEAVFPDFAEKQGERPDNQPQKSIACVDLIVLQEKVDHLAER